jgi:hypothetical protein
MALTTYDRTGFSRLAVEGEISYYSGHVCLWLVGFCGLAQSLCIGSTNVLAGNKSGVTCPMNVTNCGQDEIIRLGGGMRNVFFPFLAAMPCMATIYSFVLWAWPRFYSNNIRTTSHMTNSSLR